MAKERTYYISIPFCCGVGVHVTTDKEIETSDEALDAVMNKLDAGELRIAFLDKEGNEVPEEEISIYEGAYLKRVYQGNCCFAPVQEIDWEEQR